MAKATRSIIVWWQPLDPPPKAYGIATWPWMWLKSWGWSPVGEGGVRATMDALAERIRTRSRSPGQYLLTLDDIPFTPPADWTEPEPPYPLIVVRPKVKKVPKLTAKQLAKRATAFAGAAEATD